MPEEDGKNDEYLYRYTDYLTSVGYDEVRDCSLGTKVSVHLSKHLIVKRTPKGAWINLDNLGGLTPRRFVLLTALKQWACVSQEEALKSFKARKARQIKILENRLKDAREAVMIANQIEKGENPDAPSSQRDFQFY